MEGAVPGTSPSAKPGTGTAAGGGGGCRRFHDAVRDAALRADSEAAAPSTMLRMVFPVFTGEDHP